MQEGGGAIERVNDPAVAFVNAFNLAGFFHQEAKIRAGLLQFHSQGFLGLQIGV